MGESVPNLVSALLADNDRAREFLAELERQSQPADSKDRAVTDIVDTRSPLDLPNQLAREVAEVPIVAMYRLEQRIGESASVRGILREMLERAERVAGLR